MDPERERIQDDLRGLLDGDVRCDDLILQLYASDASIYEIRPLAVVRPRHTGDVVTCVQYAAENEIPIRPRGAGTGLAGESLGDGIVIDFSRYMNRIGEITADTVRLQPGVIHAHLNRVLASSGQIFGPDPANSAVTTMGSVLAINNTGSHWLKYGSPRDHVRSLQVVLADGSLVDLGREPVQRHDDPQLRRREVVRRVAELLLRDFDLIDTFQPECPVNRCGYGLKDIVSDRYVDMARLMAGSEGTLGIITEAEFAIQQLPAHQGVVLLLFDRLENAARAVMDVLEERPSACDLMDRRHVSLAREHDVRYDLLIPGETEALLLVQFDADDPQSVRARIDSLIDRLKRHKQFLSGSRVALDQQTIDLFWQLAHKVVPTLHQLKGSTRPLPIVEDIAVPPEALPDFLARMYQVLKRQQITASLFGHAGHGQLHVRPFLDLSNRHDVERMQRLAKELYDEALDLGGTISGEHGDGLSRTQFIRQQYGPLYETFRELKQIFDPAGILNPGKKISEESDLLVRHLRPVSTAPAKATVDEDDQPASGNESPFPLQLAWDAAGIAHTARSCIGCGACRSQLDEVRMCPIFRLAPSEEASPRAKANLVRGVLTGRLDAEIVTTDEYKQIADLCVNCHQCREECPANVDIPKLMVEAKAAYVAVNGLRPTDGVMARLDRLGSFATRFSWLANWAIRRPAMRWFMEKTLGIAQGRKLPRVARHSFLRQASKRRLTRPDRGASNGVVYFADVYANYFDTALADALVSVMRHNGVSVFVHPRQTQSAMALVTQGAVEKARSFAARNVEALAESVRQGYQIVTTEPAAASCLVHDYPNLIDDDDARLVAENTFEACTYLWRRHQNGKLKLDLKPLIYALAYHQPCHLRSLGVGSPGENLLRLIPGLTVTKIEKGCSGMAGTFGLKRENYRASLRAGFNLITSMRDQQIQAGTTECSTCKIQMEQGTTKPTVHPIKILALAYGLTPDINPLDARSGSLMVSNTDETTN
jgi:FAD/FMN-containing dehydrogenase/Fe-S oxidoreductase